MTRQQIIDRVKVKMEEVTPFDDGLAILLSEVKPMVSYIEEYIQSSCDQILMICPLHLTTPTTIPLSDVLFKSVLDNKRQVGTLTLPDDFIRLHTFKMKGWERPVHFPINTENPQYKEQFNTWGRGGNAKPIIVRNSDTLSIYTFDVDSKPEIHLFVKRIDTSGNIEINEKLVEPLCSLIAANVLGVFGSSQQKVMMQEVENSLKTEQ